jgi:hypothetical protein
MNILSRPLRHRNGIPSWSSVSRSISRPASVARHPSPSAQKWSHPPSSITIADDEVSSLASQPLHALSLADLVKYDANLAVLLGDLLTPHQTRTPSPLDRGPLLISELYPLPPPNPPRTPDRELEESPIHRSLQSQHREDLQ